MRKSLLMLILFSLLTPNMYVYGVSGNYIALNENSETIVITVDSTNFRFTPSEVTIEEGQSVRFFWSDEILAHNAVEENGFFDSGNPETSIDFTFEFPIGSNGTYAYICEPHEQMGMEGTIVVTPVVIEIEEEEEEEKEENKPVNSMPNFLLPSTFIILFLASIMRSRTVK
tara:strand:- start:1188 stop:1700 length:513 start_codon:yes stop_codon:yes gene_type:complete